MFGCRYVFMKRLCQHYVASSRGSSHHGFNALEMSNRELHATLLHCICPLLVKFVNHVTGICFKMFKGWLFILSFIATQYASDFQPHEVIFIIYLASLIQIQIIAVYCTTIRPNEQHKISSIVNINIIAHVKDVLYAVLYISG